MASLSFTISTFACGCGADTDWPLYGRDYSNQRYSPLDQINQGNVEQLGLAWSYHTGKHGTFQTSPIVLNGVMYITTPFNDVIALEAKSGQEIWRYRHRLRGDKFCCGPANRGPAVANGKVYTVTIDARLIALDQKSGAVVWDREIADISAEGGEIPGPVLGFAELKGAVQTGQTGYSANLAPQVFDGKVFVGVTGAGYGLHLELEENGDSRLSVGGFSGNRHGLRGFLVAYDAETGREIWRWYSIPELGWEGVWRQTTPDGIPLGRDIEEEKRLFSDRQENWKPGGGSIFTTPAIDPELGLLYVGTGNPSPQMDDTTRPGDNLYTVSLIALEIDTGKLHWYYQQVPHDRWGYDIASPPVLFDYKKDGRIIKAVGQASKLGWFFVHDRKTGALLLKSEPFVQQTNLFAQPTTEGVRIVPGTLGATSWSPVSYHPQAETVYIAGIHQPSLFFSRKLDPKPDQPRESYTFFRQANEPDWGFLTAISVNTGSILWQQKIEDPMVGGVLATAGGLVFTGEGNGDFDAFDARNGRRMWTYHSRYGVNAPPITYAMDGKQYVAVAAGGNQLFGYPVGDEILVFTLTASPDTN
ncbi:MAG: pyrrolo-quinoline quinone [Gammaproteobacteria bacterium RBG_16_51_14]|nr:MAG: pyrrolo-quinoline quinone [Gammaproteobacteria bacterium RBG_16_51_14]